MNDEVSLIEGIGWMGIGASIIIGFVLIQKLLAKYFMHPSLNIIQWLSQRWVYITKKVLIIGIFVAFSILVPWFIIFLISQNTKTEDLIGFVVVIVAFTEPLYELYKAFRVPYRNFEQNTQYYACRKGEFPLILENTRTHERMIIGVHIYAKKLQVQGTPIDVLVAKDDDNDPFYVLTSSQTRVKIEEDHGIINIIVKNAFIDWGVCNEDMQRWMLETGVFIPLVDPITFFNSHFSNLNIDQLVFA